MPLRRPIFGDFRRVLATKRAFCAVETTCKSLILWRRGSESNRRGRLCRSLGSAKFAASQGHHFELSTEKFSAPRHGPYIAPSAHIMDAPCTWFFVARNLFLLRCDDGSCGSWMNPPPAYFGFQTPGHQMVRIMDLALQAPPLQRTMTPTSHGVRYPTLSESRTDAVSPADRHTECSPRVAELTPHECRQGIHAIYHALGGLGEQRHVRKALEMGIAGKEFSAVVSRRRVDDGISGGQLVFAV